MKLSIFTIVLDGMPYIEQQLPIFDQLKCDWQWVVVEGTARNTRCTSWCKRMEPRLSNDGTTQYLDSIRSHPRVKVLAAPDWDGKVVMCNAALAQIPDPGVLMQVDSDEIWRPEQIEKIASLFQTQNVTAMNFHCNYFIGPNIVTTDNRGDWVRAWRYIPGDRFVSHEPPVLLRRNGPVMDKDTTRNHGLVFDHFSYVLEKQVAYKEEFYGYHGAVEQWKRFQENTVWPVKRLRDHLSFAGEHATADLFKK